MSLPVYQARLVSGELNLRNRYFENAPNFVANQTASSNWINGTAGGNSTDAIHGWYFLASTGQVNFDGNVSYYGYNSLHVGLSTTNSSPAVSNFSGTSGLPAQALWIKPNTTYTFSFWMKTVLNSGTGGSGNGATLQWIERDINGSISNASGGYTPPIIDTTTPFTQYTVTNTTGVNSVYLTPKLIILGTNGLHNLLMDAWYDGLRIIVPSPPTRLPR